MRDSTHDCYCVALVFCSQLHVSQFLRSESPCYAAGVSWGHWGGICIASLPVKRQDIIWRFCDFILKFWQFNRRLIAFHQLKRLANSNEIFEKMIISSLRVKGLGKGFAFQNISILNAQVCHKFRRKVLIESFTATKRDSHWHQQY